MMNLMGDSGMQKPYSHAEDRRSPARANSQRLVKCRRGPMTGKFDVIPPNIYDR